MASTSEQAASYRYDGHADWYDDWSRPDGSAFMAAAEAALDELVPVSQYPAGPAVDVGCGTGLRRHLAERHGYAVIGLDVSADQVRLARRHGPSLRADGRALPFADGCAALVYSVLTHTDLDRFGLLVAESVRLLRPGGSFVYVGVHPCFNNPFAEVRPDGIHVHAGYASSGWKAPTPYRPGVVTKRVGVHHLSLEGFLRTVLHPQAPIDRIVERGPGEVPEILAVRLTRPARPTRASA